MSILPHCVFRSKKFHFTFSVCGNCDFCLTDWKQERVDGAEKTSVVIRHLEAEEEYCVTMKSVSFIGDSYFTAPLKRRVFRTGTDAFVFVKSYAMPLS